MKPEVHHPVAAGLLLTSCWQTEKQARILREQWADPGFLSTSKVLWKSFSKRGDLKDRRKEAFSGWAADIVCVSVAAHGNGLAVQREQHYVCPQACLWWYCGRKGIKLMVNNRHTWKQANWRKDRQEWSVLHLWCAAPSQRASGKFSRKNLMVGLERCLAEGMRKVFKWLFTCLYHFFSEPRSVISGFC